MSREAWGDPPDPPELIDCDECYGRGYHVGPVCCGRLTAGGECRGDCAVPEQTQCDVCCGSGTVEIKP